MKRVESITVRPWGFELAQPAPPVAPDLTAEIPFNYDASVTGRAGWPLRANPLYDVRYADLPGALTSVDLMLTSTGATVMPSKSFAASMRRSSVPTSSPKA